MTLLVLNLAFAVVVAYVAWRWWTARNAVAPVDEAGSVSVRVRARTLDDDLALRCARQGLGDADFLQVGADTWADPGGAKARLAEPVLGDRSVVIDVTTERADAVVGGVVAALLAEDYEISRERERRVVLRRSGERVDVDVGPA